MTSPSRNAPCPCGSGKKYKKCCFGKPTSAQSEAEHLKAIFASGFTLLSNGRHSDAIVWFQRYLSLAPASTDAFLNLGVAFAGERELDMAIACFRRSLLIKPDYAQAHNSLGSMFKATGQLDQALDSFASALKFKPDYVEAYYNLGNILKDKISLDEAVASYRKAIALQPDHAEAHNNLGSTLRLQGQLDSAIVCYLRALCIKPNFASAYSNRLFLAGYHGLGKAQEYLPLARGWQLACVSRQDRQTAEHRLIRRTPRTGRRLRIGYVSGDYRQHAVSYFIEQVFARHDRSRIELFAYPTHNIRDAVTLRINSLVDAWIPLAKLSDQQARDRIEADGIDVLIDLSGHTDDNRLGLFALRAAPVQVHYLGYFASTGLSEIDYWIGDEILTPARMDIHFSEKVWRLPRVRMSYQAGAEAPESAWAPQADGTLWIGSFNDLSKISTNTLALWAKVLDALPEGKLLLKTSELADARNRQRILNQMAAHGIGAQRIELRDRSSTPDWASHMAYYDRLDIALDPVGGQGGATTTCDSLWMSVPVITLEGDRVAARMTASLVSAIGHAEWIAASEADYVDKVISLARDTRGRQELRRTQRSQMAHSPLCDAAGLACALEEAYESMFDRWLGLNHSDRNLA